MKKIDLCKLPEVDVFEHLNLCIDDFSKWSEARVCRHGCIKIEINDQSKESVNQVGESLHKMTGTKITSAYHPQSNGLSECQNFTIKDSLIKVLEEFSLP